MLQEPQEKHKLNVHMETVYQERFIHPLLAVTAQAAVKITSRYHNSYWTAPKFTSGLIKIYKTLKIPRGRKAGSRCGRYEIISVSCTYLPRHELAFLPLEIFKVHVGTLAISGPFTYQTDFSIVGLRGLLHVPIRQNSLSWQNLFWQTFRELHQLNVHSFSLLEMITGPQCALWGCGKTRIRIKYHIATVKTAELCVDIFSFLIRETDRVEEKKAVNGTCSYKYLYTLYTVDS